MRFQHSWKDDALDEIPLSSQENVESTIHRALDLGINHIETARGYGSSEIQLGQILPAINRESLIVQTKVAPHADPKEFLDVFETSMKRLNLDYVDLFSLHGVNDDECLDWSIRKGGCLEVVRELQRQGRVKHVGFSTHGSSDLIVQALKTGEFDYVNLHWYFVNDLNRPAIEEAARQDIGVFIISPNDKGGKLCSPPPILESLCAPLTPMAFNDLYCLANPDVHTLSIGVSKASEFDAHIEALQHYDSLHETIRPIEERLRAHLAERLGAEWCNRWSEGLPEHDDIPGNVNVKEIVRLWTYAKGLDLVAWGRMRYNLLGNAGHWFPGKKAVDFSDTDILRIAKNNPFANRLPDILREAHAMLDGEEKKRLSES
jgi:predicted aldo/keto reductase-like oxidoreductase